MQKCEITMTVVAKAVAIYLDLAYGNNRPRRLPDLSLPNDAGVDKVLSLFQRESVEEVPGRTCTRYTMRLGNRNYPFMKLLLQEHLMAGEFYFAVDTHDEMDIRPDFPDYEAWMAVRRFNSALKKKIEAQFAAEGLATSANLRDLAEQRAAGADCEAQDRTILVVDDEEDLAECVASLLRARGYRTHKAHDGRSGLDAAAALHPDLIILDYELPEMDGLEVIAALEKDARLSAVPVLLTTASRIGLDDIRRADGFLAKPFHEDLLYAVVQRLLTVGEEAR